MAADRPASPAGVTSSPAASRIRTGAISNVPPVDGSTRRPARQPSSSGRVSCRAASARCGPRRRSTVRNSSAFVPSRTSVRRPNDVLRVTPCSLRVHSAPRASPIGSSAMLPKSASATRRGPGSGSARLSGATSRAVQCARARRAPARGTRPSTSRRGAWSPRGAQLRRHEREECEQQGRPGVCRAIRRPQFFVDRHVFDPLFLRARKGGVCAHVVAAARTGPT